MRDIEGKQLLREMIEDDETIVQTETVKVTFAELRKLVREALSEEITVANEEMDAPDELVVQEDPLYPGDDGLEASAPASPCAAAASSEEEEIMAMQAAEDDELMAVLAAAEMHHDARAEGDFPRRRGGSFYEGKKPTLKEFFGPFKKGNQNAVVSFTLSVHSNVLAGRDRNGQDGPKSIDHVLGQVNAAQLLNRSLNSALKIQSANVQLGNAQSGHNTYNVPVKFSLNLGNMRKGAAEKGAEGVKKNIVDSLSAAHKDIINDLYFAIKQGTDWKDVNLQMGNLGVEVGFQ